MTPLLRRRRSRNQEGFTLIEVMASLLIFSIMTIGIAPLLAMSMQGATRSRAATVGKNLAVEAMERIRGLPYFVEYQASGRKRIDVLDLYFPNASDSNYDSTSQTYTTTCDSTTESNPPCPKDLADGYAITVVAKFIQPNSSGGYDDVIPPSDYQWDPSTANKDFPPSQLLDVTVRGDWAVGARARNYSLESFISDKSFLGERVRGIAHVDHGIEVVTTFVDSAGNHDQLTATGGTVESRIESRLLSTADQLVRAGRLHLVRLAPDDTSQATDLQILDGAVSGRHAPPDGAAANVNESAKLMQYQVDLLTTLDIARIDATEAQNVETGIANELPHASGSFKYNVSAIEDEGGEGSGLGDFWVNNQADKTTSAVLRLDPLTKELLDIRATGGQSLQGQTSARTTALTTSDPNVTSSASVSFKRLRLFRALLPVSAKDVIRIDNFTASVSCKATRAGTTAAPVASWSATVSYYNAGAAGYQSITLNSDNDSSDRLAAFGPASQGKINPLVYDGATSLDDVYLFADPANGVNGYLESWNSKFDPLTKTDDDGEVTSAAIDSAIFIHTSPTNPSLPDSGLKISIGKLGCESVDRRE
ncbi:MAG: prepilin-type N-terminal cleavage/methylation domain-containing protein [Actinomycetota bacterium]